MRLKNVAAQPHPDGNRIDLQWVIDRADLASNPDWRVRVVRSMISFPDDPQDGEDLTAGIDLPYTLNDSGDRVYTWADRGLRGETVYYYTLFPYPANLTDFRFDRHNQVAAMATAPYALAEQMYALLPGIYHRYDIAPPLPDVAQQLAAADRQKGQLRRFLEIIGGQLDQFYSFIHTLGSLPDIDTIDGQLLPLLAHWIGWETDYRQRIDTQRNEIRAAPYIYKTIGIIPTVEATIKRITGWECSTKEFVHNVFLTNQPERLNLWLMRRSATSIWDKPAKPFSLDAAYNGRPTAAISRDGTCWLFYHTLQSGMWEIWYKTRSSTQDWTPSQPLRRGPHAYRHPAVVNWDGQLLVCWDVYDQATGRWHIEYQAQDKEKPGSWQEITPFVNPSPNDPVRWRPVVAVDTAANQLWLFWLERDPDSAGWQLRYNRYDTLRSLNPATSYPIPDIPLSDENDYVFVLQQPVGGTQQLWLFWAQPEAIPLPEESQTRWRIFYRVKQSLDPQATNDWSEVFALPAPNEPATDDREPAALVRDDGSVELFWSSTRTGSWSIWHASLPDITSSDWQSIEPITGTPYSERNPLAIVVDAETLLFYRSNESLTYESSRYTATSTFDARYAGSTTVDTRNLSKIALRGRFEDFQTYTYDSGTNGIRTNDNWYARDTVGIYLTPTVTDPQQIQRSRTLLENVLPSCMPIQVRVVFIIQQIVLDRIYTYDDATIVPQRRIGEQFFDSTISEGAIPESYSGVHDTYTDTAPGWTWMRAWSPSCTDHRTVDFRTTPIKTAWRTWPTGLKNGA